jgi:hypothetical protein
MEWIHRAIQRLDSLVQLALTRAGATGAAVPFASHFELNGLPNDGVNHLIGEVDVSDVTLGYAAQVQFIAKDPTAGTMQSQRIRISVQGGTPGVVTGSGNLIASSGNIANPPLFALSVVFTAGKLSALVQQPVAGNPLLKITANIYVETSPA